MNRSYLDTLECLNYYYEEYLLRAINCKTYYNSGKENTYSQKDIIYIFINISIKIDLTTSKYRLLLYYISNIIEYFIMIHA